MQTSTLRTCALAIGLGVGSCTVLVDNTIAGKPSRADDSAGQHDGGQNDAATAAPADAATVAASPLDAAQPSGSDAASAMTSDAGASPSGGEAGQADTGTSTAPFSAGLKVSLGENFGCGLRTNGQVECWGANLEEQTRLPTDRSYRDIACGDYHSCGIDAAGALICVGRNRDGQRVSLPGPYAQVTAGDAHTCALDAAGKASCWGSNSGGQSTPPSDAFLSLSAGSGFTCGIRALDASVVCWGVTGGGLTSAVADKKFLSIDAAPTYVCGITDAQLVKCWSEAAYVAPNLGAVRQISAGKISGCALLMDETVRCWYGNNVDTLFADKAPFAQVVAGGTGRCALPKSGSILCEPVDSSALAPAPSDFP